MAKREEGYPRAVMVGYPPVAKLARSAEEKAELERLGLRLTIAALIGLALASLATVVAAIAIAA